VLVAVSVNLERQVIAKTKQVLLSKVVRITRSECYLHLTLLQFSI